MSVLNINSVYSYIVSLDKSQVNLLIQKLRLQGVSVKMIIPYIYPDAPNIKHLFFVFDGSEEQVPYYLLPESTMRMLCKELSIL